MDVLTNVYFSGCGISEIGFREAGLALQQSFEIDTHCVKTHQLNFSHEIVQTDISTKPALQDKPCYFEFGSFPCKQYSAGSNIVTPAQRKRGEYIAGRDLFLHYFRHVVLHQPDVYGLENVPGMLMYPVVMECFERLPGYSVKVFCPVDAAQWLPQSRPRLILLASKRPFQWRLPETTFRRVSLKAILEPEESLPDELFQLKPYMVNRLIGNYARSMTIADPDRDDVLGTCIAHYGKDQSTHMVRTSDPRSQYGVRPYTVREFARAMGVPDSFQFYGTPSQQYRQIGLGIAVPKARWIGGEVMRYFHL